MISAIVLAAGQGQRCGHQAKALLNFAGESFLVRSLKQILGAEVDEIIVVTGSYRNLVAAALEAWQRESNASRVRECFNSDFSTGLLSSIQAGIKACDSHTDGCLISLVDLPLLATADYCELIDQWQRLARQAIVRASWQDKPGHPVLIPACYFAEILREPFSDKGCGFLLNRHPEAVFVHAMQHGSGCIDIDTMEDYRAHIAL